MSMHPRYYVGPYVACETQEQAVTVQSMGCTNKTCTQHGRDFDLGCDLSWAWPRFCPGCGTQRGMIARQVNGPLVDVYALGEALHEALTCITISATLHCWIPNVSRDNPRDFYLDQTSESEGVIHPDQEAEISWFTRVFAAEILQIAAAYGERKVVVKWGILWETL